MTHADPDRGGLEVDPRGGDVCLCAGRTTGYFIISGALRVDAGL